MKTATLGQAQKVLSLLDGVSSENIQKVLEAGFLADALKGGQMEEMAERMERERLKAACDIITKLVGWKGVTITVCRSPFCYNPSGGYQLRCWLGEHGETSGLCPGHVDSGSAKGKLLFQTYLPKPLDECDCCWPQQLANVGISKTRFERQTKKSDDATLPGGFYRPSFEYDVLTLAD